MRKISSVMMFCSLLLLSAFARGQNVGLFTEQERDWIKTHPIVRITIDPDWRPLEYVENHQYKGLGIEYLNAIALVSGLQFERLPSQSWRDAWDAFYKGKVDLMPTTSQILASSTHRESLLFSKPYFVGSTILVTKADSAIAFDLEEMAGKRVAVKAGGAFERTLRERFPNIEIVPVTHPGQALDKVAEGAADAAMDAEAIFMPDIRRRYFGKLHVAGTVHSIPVILSMAVHSDNPILLSIIDKSLASLTALDTDRIMGKWLESRDYGAPSWTELLLFYKYETVVGALVFLCVAFLGYRTYEAGKRAERSEREKAMFLAVMSHEIRTPMNVILSCVELLKRANLAPQHEKLASVALTSANTLLDLLNDILDFSKLETGKLALERRPADIGALVNEVIVMSELRAAEKGLRISKRLQLLDGQWPVIDGHRVRQVLINLVSNAIKFTEHGEVQVNVTVREDATTPTAGTLQITVIDTGIGIAKRQQAVLFKAFSQADASMARKYGGSGLGLTICRDLIHLMGGSIGLESEVGKGTRLEISLPVALSGEVSTLVEPPVSGPVPGVALQILVIEDHPDNQFVIERQLSSLGHIAIQEQTGLAGLERACQRTFDLILLDCNLPDIDGYTVAARIRQREAEQDRHTPIIAISALVGDEHLQACFDAGFDGVLGKPLRLEELAGILSLWCDTDSLPEEVLVQRSNQLDLQSDHAQKVQMFLTTSALDMQTLDHAAQQHDKQSVARAAHRISGAAMLFNLPGVVSACKAVERCIVDHANDPELKAAILRLKEALKDAG